MVHGGAQFFDAVLVDDDVESAIQSCVPLAPLHNPHNLAAIVALRKVLPELPHIAVFDTAFHARLPRRAKTYALPAELTEEFGFRRYGFHGTSHAYVAGLAAACLKRPLCDLRLITLHLGNGASACAVEYGHSTETSMGMTPLAGLVMGTRVGDLDPGILLSLVRLGKSAEELDELLNRESGLKGLSGIGNDLRDIESQAAEGNDRAQLAMTVFAHRARLYVGAYAATMGGVDAVVFTGGIGENSATMRRRILQRLEFLGLVLDQDKNASATVNPDSPVAQISSDVSRVHALVAKTNESLSIAEQTARLVLGEHGVKTSSAIPIAISARHLHLDSATFAKLFGSDAEPTIHREISQPGQFACKQKVNLIGPKGRIDGVRLLGPLRSKNQVEVSRTDEFRLGVDAPIRKLRSG